MLFEADREHIAAIVRGIERGNSNDIQRLYALLQRGLTIIAKSRLGGSAEVTDIVADALLDVVIAISDQRVRTPESIGAFAVTIVRRRIAQHIEHQIQQRRTVPLTEAEELSEPWPQSDHGVVAEENRTLMQEALAGLEPRGREILQRFYLLGQSPELIQIEMGLTPTQFRLFKSRAKARLVAACRLRIDGTRDRIARLIRRSRLLEPTAPTLSLYRARHS